MSSMALGLANLPLLVVLCFIFFPNEFIESRGQMDVVFTDFRKAFYAVNYSILLTELELLGLVNPLLSLIKCYLSDVRQFVKVLELVSVFTVIPSGVPQGGHLSHLLFILFV